jgi:hypothetical protein
MRPLRGHKPRESTLYGEHLGELRSWLAAAQTGSTPYTLGMTMTTIKVSTETRDRLKAQAVAAHVSLGEHLSRLANAADRGLRFEALRAAIASTSPEAIEDYLKETNAWVDADLGA